jgi:uncharacterized membrane protein YdbT with pleckstrin-like domain
MPPLPKTNFVNSESEKTLAVMRLHWGIFVPSFITLFMLSLAALPLFLIIKLLANVATQFNPQASSSTSWIILAALIPEAMFFGIIFLITWISYSRSEIKLTSKRLTFSTGLFSRVYGELPLENVESIFIIESLLGRLCGYGTVAVTSLGGRTFPLSYIDSPRFFHARLQMAVAEAKESAKSPSSPTTPVQVEEDARYKPKA